MAQFSMSRMYVIPGAHNDVRNDVRKAFLTSLCAPGITVNHKMQVDISVDCPCGIHQR